MAKVTTFLMFKEKGEQAVNFYVSLFKNSHILSLARSEGDGPIPKGALMHARFQIDGQEFLAMDGGPYFNFDQGFSLFVSADTQEEIDRLWEALSASGEQQMCGWVKDKYGVSWQIVPPILGEMLNDPDAKKAKRVMDAMLQMKKLDIQTLKDAYAQ